MKLVAIPILIFLGMYSSISDAQEYNISVCDDCGFTEAKNIAIQKARPNLVCQAPYGELITVENQECFSNPERYYIVNQTSNEVLGFQLSHTNQGGKPWNMTLNVNELNLTNSKRNLLRDAVNYAVEVNEKLDTIAQQSNETYTTPTQSQNISSSSSSFESSYSFQASTSNSGGSCQDHPSYRAMADGMAPETRVNLELKLNQKYDTLSGSIPSEFENYRVTGGSAGFSKDGASFGVSGEFVEQAKYFTKSYGWLTDTLIGKDYETPRIVYQASYHDGSIHVKVNETLSRVDGVSIKELRSTNATNSGSNQLSECALEGLKVHFDYTIDPPAAGGGGGGPGTPGGGSGTPGGGTGIPGGGFGGGGTAMCDIHYYNPWTGELMFTSQTICP